MTGEGRPPSPELPTSKRLAALEKMTAAGWRGPADTMTFYGLAMEYRTLGRDADAERAFQLLRDKDPDYVPMYYQAGAMLQAGGRKDDARAWVEQGIAAARRKGDGHALGELEGLLAQLG